MIVTARAGASRRSPRDIDREVVATFAQVHEEDSGGRQEPHGAARLANTAWQSIQKQNFYPGS